MPSDNVISTRSAFASPIPLRSVNCVSRLRYVRAPVATASPPAPTAAPQTPVSNALSALLRIAPIRRAVMSLGRRKVVSDAVRLGVDWPGDVSALRAELSDTLEPLRAGLVDDALDRSLPDYYLVPFHAYEEGNLGWLPALEAEVSSYTVHAKFADEGEAGVENGDSVRAGDAVLRGNAVNILKARWDADGSGQVREVLDVGCSVGLSSACLRNVFGTSVNIVGVDPSAEMLAVATMRRPGVEYVHALGEQLPAEWSGRFDILNVSLVVHEMPDAAVRAILTEAKRVLRRGGMLCIMDVDPSSFSDVPEIFMALFMSTEPWFEEHRERNVGEMIADAGFLQVSNKMNTPRHRTYTAFLDG